MNTKPLTFTWDERENVFKSNRFKIGYEFETHYQYWVSPVYHDGIDSSSKIWLNNSFLSSYSTLERSFEYVQQIHKEKMEKLFNELMEG